MGEAPNTPSSLPPLKWLLGYVASPPTPTEGTQFEIKKNKETHNLNLVYLHFLGTVDLTGADQRFQVGSQPPGHQPKNQSLWELCDCNSSATEECKEAAMKL